MLWKKLGRVFCPENLHPWMSTHASNPVADQIDGPLFRIFFSTRDAKKRSSVGFVELDVRQPTVVLSVSQEPVLRPGEAGTFDDSGISLGCIALVDDKKFLYDMGWNLGVTVPWRNSIGLAIGSDSGCEFKKFAKGPILDRNEIDPFSLSYPWVLQHDGIWRMWYGSNRMWGPERKDMSHVIKYAESSDAIHWERKDITVIDLSSSQESGLSRPCVIREDGMFKMWFSRKSETYRIGYAESVDGIHWNRLDEKSGIDVSSSGWDSQSIEYPSVFQYEGRWYMLYNGNQFGKSGFGIAVRQD